LRSSTQTLLGDFEIGVSFVSGSWHYDITWDGVSLENEVLIKEGRENMSVPLYLQPNRNCGGKWRIQCGKGKRRLTSRQRLRVGGVHGSIARKGPFLSQVTWANSVEFRILERLLFHFLHPRNEEQPTPRKLFATSKRVCALNEELF
jgi:hypothetical protein